LTDPRFRLIFASVSTRLQIKSLSEHNITTGPRLLDRVRHAIRARHYSLRTEEAYVGWTKRPVVLSADEVQVLISHLTGVSWLIAVILYGSGVRLFECLRLRVKDVDFRYRRNPRT
jgi:integrase